MKTWAEPKPQGLGSGLDWPKLWLLAHNTVSSGWGPRGDSRRGCVLLLGWGASQWHVKGGGKVVGVWRVEVCQSASLHTL